jgi:mannose-6-phosphate isomerase-like protein (cupin superfamily)
LCILREICDEYLQIKWGPSVTSHCPTERQRGAAVPCRYAAQQNRTSGSPLWVISVQAPDLARVAGACVMFEPGARTAWHTHPLGQTLIVTFGVGRVQCEGGPIEEIRPGDVVWFSPSWVAFDRLKKSY